MSTLYEHRLIVICPVTRVAAVGAWYKANIDPLDDCTRWPALNASGLVTDAATHRWCSTALTDPQCRAVLFKLCQLAGVAVPTAATWNGWTAPEKRTWLVGVRDTILANYGVWVQVADNAAVWDTPDAALGLRGLKVQAAA